MKIHAVKKDALFSIMDLGGFIHAPEDLDKVLHFLVEKVSHLMNTDACSLFLYNPDTNTLTLKATYGLNPEMVDRLSIAPEQGLTGKTIRILKPISVADAKKSHSFLRVKDLGEEGYCSFLSVPLIYNKSPIGVMTVQNKKATRFKKEDVDFMLALSIPAVNFIEKAKFIGAMQSLTAETQKRKPGEQDKTDETPQIVQDHFVKGIPAASGISMGRIKTIEQAQSKETTVSKILSVPEEVVKLKQALSSVNDEIKETRKKAEAKFGPEEASIFEAYLLFLESANFQEQIIQEINKEKSAIQALNTIVQKYMDRMALAHDEYLKERAYDIQDVARKISDHLLFGQSPGDAGLELKEDSILNKEFWSVSDFVHFDLKKTRGLISASGGAKSHIAVLADSLNIPCVLGLGSNMSQIHDGDFVIVDGYSGTVIVNPSPSTIEIYREEIEELQKKNQKFQAKKDQHVMIGNKNKHHLPVGANLSMVAHVHTAVESGADMVGLYRTEFPFLIRKTLPTEEEQYAIYKRVVELLKGREVSFRTLDIGGDKYVPYLNLPKENNPSLGWRAIRFSLERKDLFRIQLRALLKASQHGKIRILLPMITSMDEVRQAKDMLESVKKELADEKVAFARHVPLGVMIEVPSAAEIADKLAKEVDFFALGTNDLVQYTLAVDRGNPIVANLYDPYHPAILRLAARVIQQAKKAKIKIMVCGDMASQPLLSVVLVGLGMDALSMIPRAIPKIKHLMRLLDLDSTNKLAQKCLNLDSGFEIKEALREYFQANKLGDLISYGIPHGQGVTSNR